MEKSRLKRRGMKRIVLDNLIDSRTGKKAVMEVLSTLDVRYIMHRAKKDAEESAKRFHERVRGI